MKKILALLLTAVMILAINSAVFAAPAEPEVQTGAAINAAAEELNLAEELLKKLPGSGIFEYLAGEPVPADAGLSGGVITETGNYHTDVSMGYPEFAFLYETGNIPYNKYCAFCVSDETLRKTHRWDPEGMPLKCDNDAERPFEEV